MSDLLPDCMIGPSEPCEAFQRLTADCAALREENARLTRLQTEFHNIEDVTEIRRLRAALELIESYGPDPGDSGMLSDDIYYIARSALSPKSDGTGNVPVDHPTPSPEPVTGYYCFMDGCPGKHVSKYQLCQPGSAGEGETNG